MAGLKPAVIHCAAVDYVFDRPPSTTSEKFDISPVEKKGRYCVAKIVRTDGSPIQRLLVDKQTGNIQMIGR
jgi:hypothetical protein